MKNVFTMLFLTVAMMTQARADYICTGEKNDKLLINYYKTSQQTPGVLVAYIDFDLAQLSAFKGEYSSASSKYEVLDSQGKSINLKVVTPITHGGRCGRCSDEIGGPKKPTYAKITLNDVELNFTCKLQ